MTVENDLIALGKIHMIYFEIEGQGYAVSAGALLGAATDCPFTTYPGLPRGISGIVQWSGRIFPVITLPSQSLNSSSDLHTCSFLLSAQTESDGFPEVALAVTSSIRVFVPDAQGGWKAPPDNAPAYIVATICDKDGKTALLLDVTKLAHFVVSSGEAGLAA